MTNLPNGPAVYAFENLEDGKLYIGSSVNAQRRVQHHLYLLRLGKHRNRYLQRAYVKHQDKFRVFVLEVLADCNLHELWKAEQRWITALSTTEPERGYNIHPTPISSEYVPPSSYERLKNSLQGRRRGTLTEAGRSAQERARRLAWQRPGEREYRGEIMRDIWTTFDHREKINATIAERLADPKELDAMRAVAAVSARRTTESRRADAIQAWFERHASDKFASDEAMTDWIVGQYENGSSARQIALTLGMTHHAVVYRLRKRGATLPQRGTGRRKIASSATHLARQGINDLHEFDRQVAVLRAEGNSINAIRKVYGLSADAIRNSLRRSQELDAKANAGELYEVVS